MGLIIILILGAAGIWNVAIRARDAADRANLAVSTLRNAGLGGCHRLNVLRVTDDLNALAEWRYDALTLADLRIAIHRRRLKGEQRALAAGYTRTLSGLVKKLSWVPLTDCVGAVGSPTQFQPPEAVPFSKRVPSGRELTLVKGE